MTSNTVDSAYLRQMDALLQENGVEKRVVTLNRHKWQDGAARRFQCPTPRDKHQSANRSCDDHGGLLAHCPPVVHQ